MPFGLTNAPTTFQSLMNHVFQDHIRHFVLVFFDDILVYSFTVPEHEEHLKKVLHILRKKQLYAKRSKCSFCQKKVEYLGHVMTGEGVSTDPAKIEAMASWPVPRSLKALRGFLGLTGYYRRFARNYGWISKPLTALLKKNSFKWSSEPQTTFEELKKAMSSALVLALADFTKAFIVETDACSKGIGAVLM
ncbi:uncharacterized mitochondrial protein AtMg00860-like [Lycium barbarum]|uniref:uncharacterized mitochondrial protein AtMg00860-like n=1 Tax=Lycium barbarum TaxID=112863 RepID=UPI00293E435F|nr:uncharacterized mitochondrial protein AtMg00860-like [Lycium barbarum]